MYLYASTHVRTWKKMRVYHKRECRFLQRARHAIGQQNVRWKLEDWIRASICTATLLFSQPFFCIYWEMGTGEFQTLHLCENSPHAPANSNFILSLIQCVLAFKYHSSTETLYFLFSVLHRYMALPLGWLSSKHAPDGLASSSARDDENACMGEE